MTLVSTNASPTLRHTKFYRWFGNGSATYFINNVEIGSVSVEFTEGKASLFGPQFNTGDKLYISQ